MNSWRPAAGLLMLYMCACGGSCVWARPSFPVGIGGSYMCIYPMDSPGGYQLVGRTLPIWNTFGRSGPFTAHKPWLLEFFDQVGLIAHCTATLQHSMREAQRLLIVFLKSSLVGPCFLSMCK